MVNAERVRHIADRHMHAFYAEQMMIQVLAAPTANDQMMFKELYYDKETTQDVARATPKCT